VPLQHKSQDQLQQLALQIWFQFFYHGFYFFDDTATVVIAVGVGTTNLALGKHATQSSTYLHAVFAVAGYAVDGNT
jgi:hypothetical protein